MNKKINWLGTIFISISSLVILVPLYMAIMLRLRMHQRLQIHCGRFQQQYIGKILQMRSV